MHARPGRLARRLFLLAATLAAGISLPARGESGQPPPAEVPGPIECYGVATRERVVALTFDDGPHPVLTPKLLGALKASGGVHATFFVLGMNVEQSPDVLRRAVAEGHEIANHSWSHPNLAKMEEEGWRAQMQSTHDVIAATIGRPPRFMRPPYGNITPYQEGIIARLFGYRVILWTVDPKDWKEPPRALLVGRVLSGARPGGIILLHDIHQSTVDAVPAIIAGLRQRGFRFATVSELLALGPGAAASPAGKSASDALPAPPN